MPITEKEYRALKQEVEEAKADAEQAKGALNQLMKQLADEFECETVDQAERELRIFKDNAKEAEKTYQKSLKAYERKWKK